MNLEHCRKDAKRLLRAVAAGDEGALARARAVLGQRVDRRFGLSDAQHVVAGERGYGSWRDLARATQSARTEVAVRTGLDYRPGDPVRVWVVHRERRATVSDHGAALDKAGWPPGWRRACERVHAELEVNITRNGVIWLPVVRVGPDERQVAQRIGQASLIFFQELLELSQPSAAAWREDTT